MGTVEDTDCFSYLSGGRGCFVIKMSQAQVPQQPVLKIQKKCHNISDIFILRILRITRTDTHQLV